MARYSQLRSGNSTGSISIKQSDISVTAENDADGRLQHLNLKILKLPCDLKDNDEVYAEIYDKRNEKRISLGTKAKPKPVIKEYIGDYERPSIRIYAISPGISVIKAKSKWFTIRSATKTEQEAEGIVDIEPSDNLGERLWKLNIDHDEGPVLYVHSGEEYDVKNQIVGDPTIQAFVIPEVLNQILNYLADNIQDENQEEPSWMEKWQSWLEREGQKVFDPDEDEKDEWLEDIVGHFAKKMKFRSRLIETGD